MKHQGAGRRRELAEREQDGTSYHHRPFLRSRTRARSPREPRHTDSPPPPPPLPSPPSRPTTSVSTFEAVLPPFSHQMQQRAVRQEPQRLESAMNKASIAFILDPETPEDKRALPTTTARIQEDERPRGERADSRQARSQEHLIDHSKSTERSPGKRPATTQNHISNYSATDPTTNNVNKKNQSLSKPIKKSRICKHENCTRYVVNKGLCIGHGGGKRCSIEGCASSAKHMGLCWKHGGSTKCTIEGCNNRAKARGVCWSHGGGKKCREPDCEKTAVSNGLCWAHGGGKRCTMEGCKKPAYGKNGNLCSMHQNVDRAG